MWTSAVAEPLPMPAGPHLGAVSHESEETGHPAEGEATQKT